MPGSVSNVLNNPIKLKKIPFLAANDPLFIGKVVHDFQKLASTNVYASELLTKSRPPEGTVIKAHEQWAGRGQIGSAWVSEPGKNLTLSVILYPIFLQAGRQFYLNMAVALGVYECLAHYLDGDLTIKWPNDIYWRHQKIAGILIQNTLSGAQIQSSVIGLGINVNQRDFPPEAANAGSVCLATEKGNLELDEVRHKLFQTLENRYLQLREGRYLALNEVYTQKLYRLEESSWFENQKGAAFKGTIKGVDDNGKLIVLPENGRPEHFDIKQIRFIQQL